MMLSVHKGTSLLAFLFLAGCQTMPTPSEPVSIMPQPHPGVVIRNGVTKATVIRVTEEEAILNSLVSIGIAKSTLEVAMEMIAAQLTPVPTVAFQGETASQLVRLTHNGSLKDALNQLEIQTGMAISIEDGTFVWRDKITREFEIAVLPGQRSFSIGHKPQQQADNPINDNQFMSAQGSGDTWDGIAKSLLAVMGEGGTVTPSPMMSTITVSGNPARVRTVAGLVSDLNARLKRQVHLDIKVVQVTITNKDALGIDWTLVGSVAQNALTMAGQAGTLVPGMTNGVLTFSMAKQSGKYSGSQVLVEALRTQGRVKMISQPQVMALNHQPVEQRWETDTVYLASTTASSGVDSAGQSGINPGINTDGITLFIQPNIGTEYILLHTSLTIASLIDIPVIESGGSPSRHLLRQKASSTRLSVPELGRP